MGPLIAPKVEGNPLTFEVLHHKRHGSLEQGPNKKYRMEVTNPNEMFFRIDKGSLSGSNPELDRGVPTEYCSWIYPPDAVRTIPR